MKNFKLNMLYISIIFAAGLCAFFMNSAGYPFMDNIESQPAAIAKNMLENNSMLDIKTASEAFQQLPPLYFWIVNFFCTMFGKISASAVRFPISLAALWGALIMYFGLKPLLSKAYAFIAALIFLSSAGVIVFSRLASADMLSLVFLAASALFGYNALMNKKHAALYYAGMYFFSAVSVLSAGLYGIFPIFCIFILHIISGKLKEFFKPAYFIPGIILFLISALPFYIYSAYTYKSAYIKEFLISAFPAGFESIEQFYMFLCLLIFGFFPWIFIDGSVFSIVSYLKKTPGIKLNEKWSSLKTSEKFLVCSSFMFLTGLIPAVFSFGKYPCCILFLIFPASCLIGYSWYKYITKLEKRKRILVIYIIFNLFLILLSLAGLAVYNFNTEPAAGLNRILKPLIIILFTVPLISILSLIIRGRIAPFASNVILMLLISSVLSPNIFNFICSITGENDFILFAEAADSDNAKLAAYIPKRRYSLEYYYDKPVEYIYNLSVNELKKFIEENPDTYTAVLLKDMLKLEAGGIEYTLLSSGSRYCLIKAKEIEQEPDEQTENTEDNELEYYNILNDIFNGLRMSPQEETAVIEEDEEQAQEAEEDTEAAQENNEQAAPIEEKAAEEENKEVQIQEAAHDETKQEDAEIQPASNETAAPQIQPEQQEKKENLEDV